MSRIDGRGGLILFFSEFGMCLVWCRCIPGHGQQSTWLWTMLGCGTSGQRTGQGNTWANSSTSGFTPLPIHGGMNYLSPRMPFFVAGPPVTTLGLFDFGWPSFRSREGDCQRGFSAGINLTVQSSNSSYLSSISFRNSFFFLLDFQIWDLLFEFLL